MKVRHWQDMPLVCGFCPTCPAPKPPR
jgi:hypothetical protein